MSRLVTTYADLDQLPAGAIVRERDDRTVPPAPGEAMPRVFEKWTYPYAPGWARVAGRGVNPSTVVKLPAAVLHNPDAMSREYSLTRSDGTLSSPIPEYEGIENDLLIWVSKMDIEIFEREVTPLVRSHLNDRVAGSGEDNAERTGS